MRLVKDVCVLADSSLKCKLCSKCKNTTAFKQCQKTCFPFSLFNLNEMLDKELKEETTEIGWHVQALVFGTLISGVFVVSFLAGECIVFLVEYIIFIVIGIILNADQTMQYVPFVFMVLVYAKDAMGSVLNKYAKYNAVLHEAVLENIRDDIDAVVTDGNRKEHVAFPVPNTKDVPLPALILTKKERLLWRHPCAVFLNSGERNQSFLHWNFFDYTIRIPNSEFPGPVVNNYLKAFVKLILIFAFLVFVSLTVVAFGEAYKISTFNQTIATLVTGFLPFAFEKIILVSADAFELEKDNIHFQIQLKTFSKRFKTFFKVADISAELVECSDDNNTEIMDSSIKEKGANSDGPSTSRITLSSVEAGDKVTVSKIHHTSQMTTDDDTPTVQVVNELLICPKLTLAKVMNYETPV